MDNNATLLTCLRRADTLLHRAATTRVLLDLIERFAPNCRLIVTTTSIPTIGLAPGGGGQGHGVPPAAHSSMPSPLPVKPDRTLPRDTSRSAYLSSTSIHLHGHTPGSVAPGARRADDATHLFTTRLPVFPAAVEDMQEGDFEKLLGASPAGSSTSTATRPSSTPDMARTPRSCGTAASCRVESARLVSRYP